MDLLTSATMPKTAASTPSSSPGLFSPTTAHRQPPSLSDGTPHSSPFLHPLQMHKVRETHKAQVEQDFITGRKLINQYEIIDEIGRGVHGKVKLARSLETGDYVAIKIIQRFSKKRRLGKVTVSPQDKTKREIAILKKIRHPNVVGLLEVIDDPELKKIYMVLEHVELGEIVWRKKGVPQICLYERRRIERELRGERDTGDDEKYFKMIERRRQRKEAQRAKVSQLQLEKAAHWSLEYGNEEEEVDMPPLSRQSTRGSVPSETYHEPGLSRSHGSHTSIVRSFPGSKVGSRATSRAPSRAPSTRESRAHTPLPTEFDIPPIDSDNEEDAHPLSSNPSATGLEGTMYGAYMEDPPFRGRSPSMADSIISHMSSVDDITPHDAFEDDFSYVPCFTLDQARSAFRDTVLGLEYLHYEGIVHRDIKPANLLWTKDHRVKISDFGVSYFGRPIREGETEENISEADATDFDDDLELAKTVGTPAFFAPELCFTNLDMEQPKITEQIDVWSLGITLYCLIYARIPFMAEDEFQLFKAIAQEDVYIPRRRLMAVDPNISTTNLSRRMGPWDGPYRDENDLRYESIDDELYDLLKRMLMKDPTERMKLREVKRHPWVIRGIENIIGWLDDSDPSRKTAGRRIEVDKVELEHAVVPITFLERARSVIKKTVGKVAGAMRSDKSEGSRRRAASNATSSGTDNFHPPLTPHIRENYRRASLRGDESFFATVTDAYEHREPPVEHHPLAQSQTASPDHSLNGDVFALDFAQQSSPVGATPKYTGPYSASDFDARPGLPERTVSGTASIQTVVYRGHSHSRSVANTPTGQPLLEEEGPFTDHSGNIFGGRLWYSSTRDSLPAVEEGKSLSRSWSADHGLFSSEDKHAFPSVAMSTAVAPGHLEHPQPSRSNRNSPTNDNSEKTLQSPFFFQPYMIDKAYSISSVSTPNMEREHAASNLDERPATANRTPEGKSSAPRMFGASTPESFKRAREQSDRRKRLEAEANQKRQEFAASNLRVKTPGSEYPPSPSDDVFVEEAAKRAQSYSSVNSTSMVSPFTSPSDVTSPISSVNLGSQEQCFPSVPSLPALISGASSVSADHEGEMLQRPGVPETVENTSDSMTPPALSKHSTAEVERPIAIENDTIHLNADTDEEGYNGDGDMSVAADDDDSDSDEGLTMTRHKPKVKLSHGGSMARRGTNASVGSTDTAKKVSMDS